MIEYFDRLSPEQKRAARAMAGGELGWKKNFRQLTAEQKTEFGKIIFGCEVKNITFEHERNVATGYDIPIIIADKV